LTFYSGGLLFADKYIQIATLLPTDAIYGWGENVHRNLKVFNQFDDYYSVDTFQHDFTRYITWAMFARDQPPDSGSQISVINLYGVHPFYIGLESDGKAHGVLILNSNAQVSS
jgi:hypothetical protein